MLAAAEKLMVKREGEDFTLVEVAKVGRVSIGSIYHRFSSKDALIHAVHTRVIDRLNIEQQMILKRVCGGKHDLDEFTGLFVEEFAEMLMRFAPVLRPLMVRAPRDPFMHNVGSEAYQQFADRVKEQLLLYRDEFGRPDHERMVTSVYRVIYATLARYLGLGSSSEASDGGDWVELKQDLGRMCAAFLRAH